MTPLPWSPTRSGRRPLDWFTESRTEALALGVAVAGLLLPIGLWLHNTPATLHTAGDQLTNAGRLTGLVAGYLLALVLLLMARVPWLDHRIGSDRLGRWHAATGAYAIGLVAAHVVLVTLGYAAALHATPWTQLWRLVVDYPDVLMATVGTALLIGVGVVSARAARRRLRYETWYLLHLYTYLALALAFAHEFATGAEFAGSLPARVAWATLYSVAVAAVLWYRVVVPSRAAWQHRMRVVAVRPEARDVVSIWLQGGSLRYREIEAGQYLRWRILRRGLWWQSHPYSVSARPRPDLLRITVKALGDHSRALGSLEPGTPVIATGPYGAISPRRFGRDDMLLLAGGAGVTTLRPLAEVMADGRRSIILLVRASEPADLVFDAELEQLSAQGKVDLRRRIGSLGSAQDVFLDRRLIDEVPDLGRRQIVVCGPPSFVDAARATLRRLGIHPDRVHTESFAF